MYLISYDIADPRRLQRVAKLLKRYGVRLQKSVFACDLDERRYNELRRKLAAFRNDEDSIICFRLPPGGQREDISPQAGIGVPLAAPAPAPTSPGWLADCLDTMNPEEFESPF
ncbi:MAG: CRISPR-associated endonuclease Cas2 [Kiritimatiellae bacterium]|nr:CRISPR-associated endonuclease Cas2 [Kiritimatiellia bacterium]